jgi:hypothetical protein
MGECDKGWLEAARMRLHAGHACLNIDGMFKGFL